MSAKLVDYHGLFITEEAVRQLQHWDQVHESHQQLVEFLEWLEEQYGDYTPLRLLHQTISLRRSIIGIANGFKEDDEEEDEVPPEAMILFKKPSQLADLYLQVDQNKLDLARRELLAAMRANHERRTDAID